jgi:hypothetical protein
MQLFGQEVAMNTDSISALIDLNKLQKKLSYMNQR